VIGADDDNTLATPTLQLDAAGDHPRDQAAAVAA
jgi:hypothetical protein